MLNELLVALVSPLLVAASVYPEPELLISRLLNVATPLTALTVVVPLNVPLLRSALVSDGVLGVFRRILPAMTSTEREAIEAGTVGWDGELFSGRPDWKALLALPAPKLSAD